jgi:hypothetical protein
MFSLVSSVKTKARNRMQLNLLDAIVTVRAELLVSNKCCKDFTASPEMLKNFISDKVYAVCSTHSRGEDSDGRDMEDSDNRDMEDSDNRDMEDGDNRDMEDSDNRDMEDSDNRDMEDSDNRDMEDGDNRDMEPFM